MSNPDKTLRVFRGGSWSIVPRYARVADRYRIVPGRRDSRLGLRLIEEPKTSSENRNESNHPRVIRGGSWLDLPRFAQVAYSFRYEPGTRVYSLGLRLIEEVSDEFREQE
jgi:formylglycine-generating enzyme required for sulfatase activity